MATDHSTPVDRRRVRSWEWALLGTALLVPTLPNLIYLATTPQRTFWLGQSITSALIVVAPLLAGISVRATLLLLLPFALITPFVSAYALATGFPPSVLALQVLREATTEELSAFVPAIVLASTASLAIASLYGWTASRWRARAMALPRAARILGFTLLLLVLGKDVATSGIESRTTILRSRFEKMHPVAPLALLASLKLGRNVVPDRADVLARASAAHRAAAQGREICVLVLGESARKRAFGLYNPQLDTTPRLRSRPLVIFQDAVSCGTATIQSVPIMLTGQLPDDGEILPFRHVGLIEAFRRAGFHTAWLSTQEADGEITSFISAFSSNAHERRFLNGRMERSKYRDRDLLDDSALLAPLSSALRERGDNLFIVLQTSGSHMPYLRRYPAGFEKWPVDAAAKSSMWRWLPPFDSYQREQLERAYLNTVLYTDWFLDQVIALLEASGAVSSMIYLSDHGENDAAASQMPAGHAVLTEDVVKIPMFMWLSSEFRLQRPEIARALQANTERRVSAQDIFTTVCAMHGLETAAAVPARNLASTTYREHDRKVLLLDGTIVTWP